MTRDQICIWFDTAVVLTLLLEANLPFFLSYIGWFGGLFSWKFCMTQDRKYFEDAFKIYERGIKVWGCWSKTQGAEGDLPTNEGIGTSSALLIWQPWYPQVANLLHLGEFLQGGQEILFWRSWFMKFLIVTAFTVMALCFFCTCPPQVVFSVCWSRENNENWKSEKRINLYQIIFGTFWQHIDYFPSSKKDCSNCNLSFWIGYGGYYESIWIHNVDDTKTTFKIFFVEWISCCFRWPARFLLGHMSVTFGKIPSFQLPGDPNFSPPKNGEELRLTYLSKFVERYGGRKPCPCWPTKSWVWLVSGVFCPKILKP